MSELEMHIILNKEGELLSSKGLESEIVNKVLADLNTRFAGKYHEILDFINEKAFIYNKFESDEYAWYLTLESGKLMLKRILVDTMSKTDLANLLEEIHYQSRIDYKRIVMRNYSHDLSNLLTILLINLGYLNDELNDGNITTSADETVKQIISSSLKSTTDLKALIEKTRAENEWTPESIIGQNQLRANFSTAIELVRHQIVNNTLFICNLPKDRPIGMNSISFIRSINIILTNALEAAIPNTLSIFEFTITEEGDYDVFTLQDNGRGFSDDKEDIEKRYKMGLGLTNLEKLLAFTQGEVIKESGDKTKVCIKIPKVKL